MVSLVRRSLVLALFAALLLAGAASTAVLGADGDAAPLKFIEDMGQVGPPVAFHAEGASHRLEFAPSSAAIHSRSGDSVALRFEGASNPTIEGLDPDTVAAHVYFAGEPGAELTDIPVYGALVYRTLYPGIDVTYTGDHGTLRRTIEIGTTADPKTIRMAYGGSTDVTASGGGATIATTSGDLAEAQPVAYQLSGPTRTNVTASLAVKSDDTVGITLGSYDTGKPLFIELSLDYGALLGGPPAAEDDGMSDPSGDMYFTQPGSAPGVSEFDAALLNADDVGFAPAAFIPGGDLAGGDLIPADGDVLSGTFTNVGKFHVQAGVTVFVDPGVPLQVEAVEILVEGTINADGAGNAGGATNPVFGTDGLPGGGPGGGSGGEYGPSVHGNGGGGGAYGGNGGNSSSLFTTQQPPSLGGTAYGSPNPPGIMMGSGGGSGANYGGEANGGPGGSGGGAVSLVGTFVTVSGTISANGAAGSLIDNPGPGGGGGSGGGIWLDGCLTLTGAALQAAGGDGAGQTTSFSQGGGGGGGGRIKLSGTIAPGATYNADVSGGAPGPFGTCCDLPSTPATPGGLGTAVNEATPNGGPCVQAPAPVGGVAVGRAEAMGESVVAETDRTMPRQTALLAVMAVMVAALGGATIYTRRRR